MRRIPPASPSPASRMSMRGLSREASSSAHFPKSVLHSQHPPSRTSESHGLLTNLLILVPLYRSEVPDRIRRLWCRDFGSAVLSRDRRLLRFVHQRNRIAQHVNASADLHPVFGEMTTKRACPRHAVECTDEMPRDRMQACACGKLACDVGHHRLEDVLHRGARRPSPNNSGST